ncbi:MAG: hypothetical protein A2017_09285 [Lentisphaerae bacterium GWF2_44_16]|nr:MAG: hypothetical protein A2017_09285 [Lentisphaerae bacterium GWF2_44_16]
MPDPEEKKEMHFKPPAKLIVIDDSPLNISFVTNSFASSEYMVMSAKSGAEGIEMIKNDKPELVLLDIMMPELNGYEVAEILKNDPSTRDIPIIFITALDAIKDKLKAFEAGAVDFVTKPFNHKELIARVRTNIELRRVMEQNERMFRMAMEEKHNSAVARIAAGISHNFNNMLGVSFGNLMLIESIEGNKFDALAKDALADVKKSLARMQAMVKQFLVLANRSSEHKGGTPHPTLLNLYSVLDDVIANLKIQKENAPLPLNLNCVNEVDTKTDVYFDIGHLNEIFNLILNELVDTTMGKVECTIKANSADNIDNTVRCEIIARNIPHTNNNTEDSIFEPFALPIASVGAGLSFSVAKHLVEENGGTVKAFFPEKKVIIFQLSFPASKTNQPE